MQFGYKDVRYCRVIIPFNLCKKILCRFKMLKKTKKNYIHENIEEFQNDCNHFSFYLYVLITKRTLCVAEILEEYFRNLTDHKSTIQRV